MGIGTIIVVQVVLTVAVAAIALRLAGRGRHAFGTPEERATLRALAFATSTLGALRHGLSPEAVTRVLPELCAQSGAAAVGLYDTQRLLGFVPGAPGPADSHRLHIEAEEAMVLEALRTGRLRLLDIHPDGDGCSLRRAAVAPLIVDDRPLAALVTYHEQTPLPAEMRITTDLAELLATQLRLERAEQQREELAQFELRALRAQISPHFVYNTLTTIAAFIRTDPSRARELVTEFADFTRKAFRGPQGEFAALADELVYVHQYLLFEEARFGERLQVRYDVAPEVLNTAVPTLVVQPLVENAVKHGIESHNGAGSIFLSAEDHDDECWIVVRDNGIGFDIGAGRHAADGALANIDRRLRRVFGPAHGLDIESTPGQGTTVRMRVPKYRPGVRPS
jgi:two-component system, LytTR family, sensor kinase